MINTCTEEMKDVDIDLSDVECITSNNNTAVEDLLVWSQNQKQLTIDPNDSGRYDLQILSSEGRLVHQNRSISYASVINLDQVQTGIYFVRIVNLESGNIGLKKIFVY